MITRLELGGAQRVVLHTAKNLNREEFEVGLIWGPGDRLDTEVERISDLGCFPVNSLARPVAPIEDMRALGEMRSIIRSFCPDLVHTHSSKAGILGRLAAQLENTPLVVHTIHGFGFTPLQSPFKRLLFRSAERLAARWTDHFITVSDCDRRRGVEMGLFAAERATVVRAGIKLDQFFSVQGGEMVRTQLGIPLDVPLITQIGNFKPQKAPLDFVRMAERVRLRFPNARFVMVGDGPLRGKAESLASDSNLTDHMVFCGWWEDVPGLLAATTVSVLSSRHEGLPCSVVESLAAGVPVVATAVDGIPEVVRPGNNGYLAAAGNVEELADGVCHILEDPSVRARMEAAAPSGLEDFDIDFMVRRQEDLYQWLGGRSRS